MPEVVEQQPAPPPARRERLEPRGSAGDTVTVACKMPNGLRLRLFEMEEVPEPMFGGGVRMTKRARQIEGADIVLNGAAVNLEEVGKGNLPSFVIAGGYALTPGVPRDQWEAWLEQNKHSALVRNNIVFCYKSEEGARKQALEQAEVRSGLEPIDPERPPSDVRRVRRGTHGNDADNL